MDIEMMMKCLLFAGAEVQQQRGMPARGTKPLPRNLWDERDLQEQTGGQYTHRPMRVKR